MKVKRYLFKTTLNNSNAPLLIYGDFESLTTKTGCDSKPVDPTTSHSYKYQQHAPSGFKLNVVNSISETIDTTIYKWADCMDVFCKKIREIESDIMKILTANNKMIMTEQEEQDFANAT